MKYNLSNQITVPTPLVLKQSLFHNKPASILSSNKKEAKSYWLSWSHYKNSISNSKTKTKTNNLMKKLKKKKLKQQ